MGYSNTLTTSGDAVSVGSQLIKKQIKHAESHLGRIALKYGQGSTEYHRAAQGLEAAKRLHHSLCGDEAPLFVRAQRGIHRG